MMFANQFNFVLALENVCFEHTMLFYTFHFSPQSLIFVAVINWIKLAPFPQSEDLFLFWFLVFLLFLEIQNELKNQFNAFVCVL